MVTRRPAMGGTISEFYRLLAQVNFTVLGFWFVVVELRHRRWAGEPRRRWGAQLVAMHFLLPGLMGLVNAIDPDSAALWRTGFAVCALLGGAGTYLLGSGRRGGPRPFPVVTYWLAIALYAAVALVAVFAGVMGSALAVDPLAVEAILLSVVLFLGLSLAFSVLFSTAQEPAQQRD